MDPQNETLDLHPHPFEPTHVPRSDPIFKSTSPLEILNETIRILRFNLSGFMAIGALLICPVSAVLLSNILVNQSIVTRFTNHLLSAANKSGLPKIPLIQHSCHKLSETAVSILTCFPFFITLLLLSKAAVVYTVDCTYSRKTFDSSKFYSFVKKIWPRVISTYLLICTIIIGCVTIYVVFILGVGIMLFVMGVTPDLVYVMLVLVFVVLLANVIIVCDLALVISVLDDVWGSEALMRSMVLIRGQRQVGLMIFLGSVIGLGFIEGLFEYRVKTLSYGDGSSRIWEGPLLVMMYSFVVLVGFMMSTVFFFSCKAFSLESVESGECELVLEAGIGSDVR